LGGNDAASLRTATPRADEPPNYTGLDVIIVRDGKISALYVFLDSPPT
jgi:ketosteroid isomerase-like protein